jgi:hypothetical protein
MTTLALGVVIAACAIVGVLVAVVRRMTARSPATVDLSNVTVSRQWLIQHQSNDRS